mgnify:FL=1
MDFFLFFSRCADLTPNPPMRYAIRPNMSTFILASDLAPALGITVKTLRRWIAAGKIPPPSARPREWLRWPLPVAVAALEARGCPVPAAWTQGERVAA